MAKLSIKAGTTDVTLQVFVPDSASTTGGGKTGIAYDAASFTCYYAREKTAAAAITLATQTVTGAHSDGGWVEIDATNLPGLYRLDLPDAVLATGVRFADVMLKGAAGMAPVTLEIDLNSEVVAASLGTQAKADVNAEVVDTISTDTIADTSQQAPPDSPTFTQMVRYLYNSIFYAGTATASEKAFYNSAGTKVAKKSLSDDSTTYTESKAVSGA